MLVTRLPFEAWVNYMLIAITVIFASRVSQLNRSSGTANKSDKLKSSRVQGNTNDQQVVPRTNKASHPKTIAQSSNPTSHSNTVDMSLYAFIPTFLYFGFMDVYLTKLTTGSQLFLLLRSTYFVMDVLFPMAIHSIVLSYGFSPALLRSYLRVIFPFLGSILAFCLYQEFRISSVLPIQFISVYASATTNCMILFLHIYFILIDFLIPFLLLKNISQQGGNRLCLSSYVQDSYRPRPMSHFQRICFMIYQHCDVYKAILWSIFRSATLLINLLRFSRCAVYARLVLSTVTVLILLEPHFVANYSPCAHNLLTIMLDPLCRKLFYRYASSSASGMNCLAFLYDTSIYRLHIISSRTPRDVKETLIALATRWFCNCPFFPLDIVQRTSEKIITLVLRHGSSERLVDMQDDAISLLFLPERYVLLTLNSEVITSFYNSYLGLRVQTLNKFFCRTPVCDSSDIQQAIYEIYELKPNDKRVRSLINILSSNPSTALVFPLLVSQVTPSLKISKKYSITYLRDMREIISTDMLYKWGFFGLQNFTKSLIEIMVYFLASDTPDTVTAQQLGVLIQELEAVHMHHRFFATKSSAILNYIRERIHPIVGSRKYEHHHAILAGRASDSSASTSRDSYLQALRLSVTAESNDLSRSVDDFLLTTFCPKLSTDSIRKAESSENTANNSQGMQPKEFVGRYLVMPTYPLQQPMYKLFKDLENREKQKLCSLCLPKHAIFNNENFILNINLEVDEGEYFIFQESNYYGNQTTSLQFAHSRDGTERSPRIIPRSMTKPSSRLKKVTISNYVKLFRLTYSAFHHLNLITIFNLPPRAISILCLRFTSGEQGAYYNSSTTLQFVKSVFLFTYSLNHNASNLLSKDLIFAMLLAALCSNFQHSGLSNTGIISSRHWLADLYADRYPSTNFCAAMGWIAIVESGLLAYIDTVSRKNIRAAFLSLSQSMACELASSNYYELYKMLMDKNSKLLTDAFKLKLCQLFMSFVTFSDQAYNKATALYSSFHKYLDLQIEERHAFHTLIVQEPYLMKYTDFQSVIPPSEISKTVCISLPILLLIKEALLSISQLTGIVLEQGLKQLELFIKHTNTSTNMWSSILKEHSNRAH